MDTVKSVEQIVNTLEAFGVAGAWILDRR